MHPRDNTSIFKAFIFKRSILIIFIGFLILYFLMSILFSIVYFFLLDSVSISILSIFKFSILTSFNFSIDKIITGSDYFFVANFLHKISALILSTIFTAAIVLKFFYLPVFFEFKRKCNYLEDSNKLIISFYNSVDIFVTNCRVRVYCRKEIIEDVDGEDIRLLINISDNPIYTKTYPFMDPYLVTRLRIELKKSDELCDWIHGEKVTGEKLDIIILLEANASNLDSSVYEVYTYSLIPENIKETIDFCKTSSIDLVNDNHQQSQGNANYKNSKGWDKFDECKSL